MLSRLFLLKNKKCCGQGCLMCPYEPKHFKYSTIIRIDILAICSKGESEVINSWRIKL